MTTPENPITVLRQLPTIKACGEVARWVAPKKPHGVVNFFPALPKPLKDWLPHVTPKDKDDVVWLLQTAINAMDRSMDLEYFHENSGAPIVSLQNVITFHKNVLGHLPSWSMAVQVMGVKEQTHYKPYTIRKADLFYTLNAAMWCKNKLLIQELCRLIQNENPVAKVLERFSGAVKSFLPATYNSLCKENFPLFIETAAHLLNRISDQKTKKESYSQVFEMLLSYAFTPDDWHQIVEENKFKIDWSYATRTAINRLCVLHDKNYTSWSQVDPSAHHGELDVMVRSAHAIDQALARLKSQKRLQKAVQDAKDLNKSVPFSPLPSKPRKM